MPGVSRLRICGLDAVQGGDVGHEPAVEAVVTPELQPDSGANQVSLQGFEFGSGHGGLLCL